MQNVRTSPASSTVTWLCSQTISGNWPSMISLERLPITGISSAGTVNDLRMRYLGIGRDGTSSPVDRDELRSLQTPLKERYRDDAETALLTLTADGELGAEGVACSVGTGRALV